MSIPAGRLVVANASALCSSTSTSVASSSSTNSSSSGIHNVSNSRDASDGANKSHCYTEGHFMQNVKTATYQSCHGAHDTPERDEERNADGAHRSHTHHRTANGKGRTCTRAHTHPIRSSHSSSSCSIYDARHSATPSNKSYRDANASPHDTDYENDAFDDYVDSVEETNPNKKRCDAASFSSTNIHASTPAEEDNTDNDSDDVVDDDTSQDRCDTHDAHVQSSSQRNTLPRVHPPRNSDTVDVARFAAEPWNHRTLCEYIYRMNPSHMHLLQRAKRDSYTGTQDCLGAIAHRALSTADTTIFAHGGAKAAAFVPNGGGSRSVTLELVTLTSPLVHDTRAVCKDDLVCGGVRRPCCTDDDRTNGCSSSSSHTPRRACRGGSHAGRAQTSPRSVSCVVGAVMSMKARHRKDGAHKEGGRSMCESAESSVSSDSASLISGETNSHSDSMHSHKDNNSKHEEEDDDTGESRSCGSHRSADVGRELEHRTRSMTTLTDTASANHDKHALDGSKKAVMTPRRATTQASGSSSSHVLLSRRSLHARRAGHDGAVRTASLHAPETPTLHPDSLRHKADPSACEGTHTVADTNSRAAHASRSNSHTPTQSERDEERTHNTGKAPAMGKRQGTSWMKIVRSRIASEVVSPVAPRVAHQHFSEVDLRRDTDGGDDVHADCERVALVQSAARDAQWLLSASHSPLRRSVASTQEDGHDDERGRAENEPAHEPYIKSSASCASMDSAVTCCSPMTSRNHTWPNHTSSRPTLAHLVSPERPLARIVIISDSDSDSDSESARESMPESNDDADRRDDAHARVGSDVGSAAESAVSSHRPMPQRGRERAHGMDSLTKHTHSTPPSPTLERPHASAQAMMNPTPTSPPLTTSSPASTLHPTHYSANASHKDSALHCVLQDADRTHVSRTYDYESSTTSSDTEVKHVCRNNHHPTTQLCHLPALSPTSSLTVSNTAYVPPGQRSRNTAMTCLSCPRSRSVTHPAATCTPQPSRPLTNTHRPTSSVYRRCGNAASRRSKQQQPCRSQGMRSKAKKRVDVSKADGTLAQVSPLEQLLSNEVMQRSAPTCPPLATRARRKLPRAGQSLMRSIRVYAQPSCQRTVPSQRQGQRLLNHYKAASRHAVAHACNVDHHHTRKQQQPQKQQPHLSDAELWQSLFVDSPRTRIYDVQSNTSSAGARVHGRAAVEHDEGVGAYDPYAYLLRRHGYWGERDANR